MSSEDKELAELRAIAEALGPAYVAMVDQQAALERDAAKLIFEAAAHRRRVAEVTAELSARLAALEGAPESGQKVYVCQWCAENPVPAPGLCADCQQEPDAVEFKAAHDAECACMNVELDPAPGSGAVTGGGGA